jgi:hypothetical protein
MEPREKVASAIHAALSENEDALVMGSVEGRDTLIDGSFDLLAIADRILAIPEIAEALTFYRDRVGIRVEDVTITGNKRIVFDQPED